MPQYTTAISHHLSSSLSPLGSCKRWREDRRCSSSHPSDLGHKLGRRTRPPSADHMMGGNLRLWILETLKTMWAVDNTREFYGNLMQGPWNSKKHARTIFIHLRPRFQGSYTIIPTSFSSGWTIWLGRLLVPPVWGAWWRPACHSHPPQLRFWALQWQVKIDTLICHIYLLNNLAIAINTCSTIDLIVCDAVPSIFCDFEDFPSLFFHTDLYD